MGNIMIPIGKTFASGPIEVSERYNGKWVYMHNVTTFSDAQFTCDVMLCGAVRARDCFRGGSYLSKFNIAR